MRSRLVVTIRSINLLVVCVSLVFAFTRFYILYISKIHRSFLALAPNAVSLEVTVKISEYNNICLFSHAFSIRSDEGLTFESLYGGQFTLSTQLIKPNYLVILPTDVAPHFFF